MIIYTENRTVSPALLVAFLCNHCPYVRYIEVELGRPVARYPSLAVVGICTNDAEAYPDDRPERLADQARRALWTFPVPGGCRPDSRTGLRRGLYAGLLSLRPAATTGLPGGSTSRRRVTASRSPEHFSATPSLTCWPVNRYLNRIGPAWAAPSSGGRRQLDRSATLRPSRGAEKGFRRARTGRVVAPTSSVVPPSCWGDGEVVEPSRPDRIKVAANANAVLHGRCMERCCGPPAVQGCVSGDLRHCWHW
jgi:hypothetical protein